PSGDQILLMNADGSGLTNFTVPGFPDVASDTPSWSPDGNKIAFASGPFFAGSCSSTLGAEIYVMNVNGTMQPQQLTFSGNSINNVLPRWSPDGSKLLFE